MSRYVELSSSRGKIFFSEIISDLSLTSPVYNTVDIRIDASPAVDNTASEFFSANFHIEQVVMRCYVIVTNIFREMGCNEGLYHCLCC